jgi:predicted homoserine dehydrogenase-like protein
VVAAGKGTKYLPAYHASDADTVWPYYGFTQQMVDAGDFNAQMFNSFHRWHQKARFEMAAVRQRHRLDARTGWARISAMRCRRSASRAATAR